MSRTTGFDDEDEFGGLLFDTKPTPQQNIVYAVNAFLVGAIPIYLYNTVWDLEFSTYFIAFIILTLGSAFGIFRSYISTTGIKGRMLASERSLVLSQSSVRVEGSKDTKNAVLSALRHQQSTVTTHEAIAFSIIVNNLVFLGIIIFSSGYLFRNYLPIVNYVTSISVASFLTYFSSQSLGKL
eukprot:TRINITY_DN3919_c0_g1_i2.p1 TRINITY_DN3919_c0_g1~~TRINITY_DN3919_c0_g1_i2.p1  ORF type:complete len:182 (+),score=38.75 TRINITY_DN3919_c0_g1_i2:398-943(+)